MKYIANLNFKPFVHAPLAMLAIALTWSQAPGAAHAQNLPVTCSTDADCVEAPVDNLCTVGLCDASINECKVRSLPTGTVCDDNGAVGACVAANPGDLILECQAAAACSDNVGAPCSTCEVNENGDTVCDRGICTATTGCCATCTVGGECQDFATTGHCGLGGQACSNGPTVASPCDVSNECAPEVCNAQWGLMMQPIGDPPYYFSNNSITGPPYYADWTCGAATNTPAGTACTDGGTCDGSGTCDPLCTDGGVGAADPTCAATVGAGNLNACDTSQTPAVCVDCTDDDDCIGGTTPLCASDNTCVACLGDGDCDTATGEVCDSTGSCLAGTGGTDGGTGGTGGTDGGTGGTSGGGCDCGIAGTSDPRGIFTASLLGLMIWARRRRGA